MLHLSNPNKPNDTTELTDLLIVFKLTVSTVLLVDTSSAGPTCRRMMTRFRQMDPLWTVAALGVYGLMLAVSAWRWRLLLRVQTIDVSLGTLTKSFLVATFFNNFLPSNIGGDVVRVADTAPFAGSKTLATTVVLIDRILGLIALLVLAAVRLRARVEAWSPAARACSTSGSRWSCSSGGLLFFLRNPDLLARTVRSILADRLQAVQTRVQNLVSRDRTIRPGSRGDSGPRSRARSSCRRCSCSSTSAPRKAWRSRSRCSPPPSSSRSAWPCRWCRCRSTDSASARRSSRSSSRASGSNVSSALTLSLGSAALIMLFSLSGGAVFMMRPRGARMAAAGPDQTAELL